MRRFILIAALLMAPPLAAQEALRSITVSGEAQVVAVPDMATVSVGASFTAKTAIEAMNATSEALEAVIARLTAAGIEERDIQTSSLNIRERTRYDQNRQIEVSEGFQASNQLSVRVRDLPRLGEILGAVLEDGANTLAGLSFGIQEPKPLQDEARRRAVQDALDKADLYAGAAGVSLGQVISIRDTAEPMVRDRAMDQPVLMEMSVARDVPIAAGEVSATAMVTLVLTLTE